MGEGKVVDPSGLLGRVPLALAVFDRVRLVLDAIGPYEVRVQTSQVAFWRAHGFAYLWLPGQYLRHPAAEVVLSIALGREAASPRFKQIAHPSARQWVHHLEVRAVEEIDDEVAGWLREAADRAS